MKKNIRVFRVHPAPPDAVDLARKISRRRLERRQAAFAAASENIAWLERENAEPPQICGIAAAEVGVVPPSEDDFHDIWADIEKQQAEENKRKSWRLPREIRHHPDYLQALPDEESLRIIAWCRARLRAMPVATKFHDKMAKDERVALLDSCRRTEAVYLSEHEIDVVFADVHKQFPWLAQLTEKAWKQARRRSAEGRPAGVGPLLIQGPPGLGKSTWARAVADAMGVPSIAVDAGATGGIFEIQGVAKGWGGTDRGRLVASIVTDRIANPLVIVDEIDAGSSAAGLMNGGTTPGLYKVLMGLIEPSTARAWVCPSYQVPFDMRHVSWIATSNNISNVEQALLDRMTLVDLPDMTDAQLLSFAASQAALRLGDDMVDLVLGHVETSIRSGKRLSLRHVTRVLDRVAEALDRPMLH